jgi:hypothetical protein
MSPDLILRRALFAPVSKDVATCFETRPKRALLSMRSNEIGSSQRPYDPAFMAFTSSGRITVSRFCIVRGPTSL